MKSQEIRNKFLNFFEKRCRKTQFNFLVERITTNLKLYWLVVS